MEESGPTFEDAPQLTLKAVPSSIIVGNWERQMSTARSQACLQGGDRGKRRHYKLSIRKSKGN